MEISDRIRCIRKKNKLSQAAFGEKIGVSRSVISNIEYNIVKPSELIIKAVSSEYGVNEDWIRTGEGEPCYDEKNRVTEILKQEFELNSDEVQLIKNYLSLKKEYRIVIDKLISFLAEKNTVSENHFKASPARRVKVYRAAKSLCNKEDQITDISEDIIEKLKNAPKVDKDF